MGKQGRELRNHKILATGLLLLMVVLFILTKIYYKQGTWMGYVNAFSEAAMVGALADWFAVTALFSHPFGVKIPHTNLIENNKNKIGDNLGNFVINNFISPKNLFPYISTLKATSYFLKWMSEKENKELLISRLFDFVLKVIHQFKDEQVIGFISKKLYQKIQNIELDKILASAIDYLLNRNDLQEVITNVFHETQNYVLNHQELIRQKVSEESYFFIPQFIDEKLAEKIIKGFKGFLTEVIDNPNHEVRISIVNKINEFKEDLKTSDKWKSRLVEIRNYFFHQEKIDKYVEELWESFKIEVVKELENKDSKLRKKMTENLEYFMNSLKKNEELQNKIDRNIRIWVYKIIFKNRKKIGDLISNTVKNWKGKELSQKLELEVGKDLQYIRINGTLVGGIVGLMIYFLTHLISR